MIFAFTLKRSLKMGFKSLWLHKLRSILTVLGITLGVSSVIAMLAIGTGASEEAQEQIRKLGSTNIIIESVKPPQDEQTDTQQSHVVTYGLTKRDADLIEATCPHVDRIVRSRHLRGTVSTASGRLDTEIIGTQPDFLTVNNVNLVKGRFITPADMVGHTKVCVIGRGAARKLFPLGGEMGKIIKQGPSYRFEVVGVVSALPRGEYGSAASGNGNGTANAEIYIPLATMEKAFGKVNMHRTSGSFSAEQVELHELVVQAEHLNYVRAVESVVRHVLKRNHKKSDYVLTVPLHLLVQARRTRWMFNIVLGSIAAISLVVGGIGIMNISLATVMERTREIGIRRAMGAKRRHIVFQFLTETVLLALFGGFLGITLGVLAPMLVQTFAGMRTIVTLWSLILAFGISAAVGVIFGIYPAYRAANMDPIEALRHE